MDSVCVERSVLVHLRRKLVNTLPDTTKKLNIKAGVVLIPATLLLNLNETANHFACMTTFTKSDNDICDIFTSKESKAIFILVSESYSLLSGPRC